MKIPEDTICSIAKCKKIFCCANCRKKHENNVHGILINSQQSSNGETIDPLLVLCPICSNQPLLLNHENIFPEVLIHIKENHLPLHCQKCEKIFTKIEELRDFSKCDDVGISNSMSEKENCVADGGNNCLAVPHSNSSKAFKRHNPIALHSISTQTSPMLASGKETISVINERWYARTQKSMQEISFSSIKNTSLSGNVSYNRRSSFHTDAGKLVRTTSTPVHRVTEHSKPKEQTFDASGSQVSSIYNSGSVMENDKNSPVEKPASLNANMAQGDSAIAYRKFTNRQKIAAVTPLRQVMSKSIQKAFAIHGHPSHSIEKKKQELNEAYTVLTNFPLDLRLSPALRRTQSDSIFRVKTEPANPGGFDTTATSRPQIYLSSTKKTKTTNSINITRSRELHNCATIDEAIRSDSAVSCSSNNSVYKTCQSFEIITSTELSELDVSGNLPRTSEANDELYPLKNVCLQKIPTHLTATNTPITRLSGATINKKLIKFSTPDVKNDSSCEKFYTPRGSPDAGKRTAMYVSGRLSPMKRPSIHECAQSTAYSHCEIDDDYDGEDVFRTPTAGNSKKVETTDNATQHGNGFIWSFMSSVLEKGTRFLDNKRVSFAADAEVKQSILKRCSSMAGSLVRSNSLLDEKQFRSMKRKRTSTCDPTSPVSDVRRMDSLPLNLDNTSSSKRFRIQGRKPIERMRNTSL